MSDADDREPQPFRETPSPGTLTIAESMGAVARHYAQELAAQFRTLNYFATHAGEIGRSHESYLRDVVERFLPRRWKVGTGFVAGGRQVSSQQDLLIFDDVDSRPLFEVGDCVVVPVEAVAGTIEVKTTLTGGPAFQGCVETMLEHFTPFRGLYVWDGLSAEGAVAAVWSAVRAAHERAQAASEFNLLVSLPDYIYVRSKYVIFARRHPHGATRSVPLKLVRLDEEKWTDGHALLGLVAALWRGGLVRDRRLSIPGWLEHWATILDDAGEPLSWPAGLEPS